MKRLLSISCLALFTTLLFSTGALAAIQCYQCHGTTSPPDYRPLDAAYRNVSTGGFKGNHRTHLRSGALPSSCNPCHGNGINVSTYLVSHRNKSIAMVANINNSPKVGGATYSKGVFFNQTSVPVTGSCSNVNCHFESTTATWQSAVFVAPNDCNKCHGVPPSGGAAGAAGSHARHELFYSGPTNCQKCHSNNTSFAHATSAGKRNLNISFAAAPNNGSGAYSGALNDYLPSQTNAFGTCSATFCHGSAPSPKWGSGPLACSACHGASNALSGAHNQHWEDATVATSYTMAVGNSGTAGVYRFSCSSCHNPASATHATGPANAFGAAQVFFGFTSATRKGTYTYGGTSAGSDNGFSWTAGTGCQNTYCHSNGQGGAPANTTFTWSTASGTLLCTGCHGNAASGTLSGKHAQHVNNAAVLGTNNSFGCVECHARTVSNSTTISNKLNHVNKLKDYSGAKANDTYNTATKTCTSAYCHSNGNMSSLVYVNPAAWNSATTYGCNGCHGTSNAVTGAPDYVSGAAGSATANSHSKHVAGMTDTRGCANCHYRTVDAATAGKLRNYSTLHLNKTADVAFKQGGTYNSGTTQCASTYCHSNGTSVSTGTISASTSVAWGTVGPLACTSCHTYPPAYTSGSPKANSHGNHSAFTCDKCHFSTTTNGTTIASAALHGNKAYNVNPGSGISFTYSFATGGGTCSSGSCHFNTTTPAWGSGSINCLGCHSLAQLMAPGNSHSKHISNSLTPTMYNYTANRSTAGEYNFGCSNCHPLATANHMNGTVNVTLQNNEAGVGSLRTKNSATAAGLGIAGSGITGTSKSNVVCSASYCHSNGNAANLIYAATPNWYGGSFSGDRCANCHGNSPNSTIAGSKSHYNTKFLGYTSTAGGHQIGIHAMKIYSSPSGLAKAGTSGDSSHGNAGTSTTISCNICHYATVTSARNDNNPVCKTCHVSGNTVGAAFGNLAAIADKSKHVNGTVNIAFQPVNILSKAQMRNSSFIQSLYSSTWKRNVGYKVNGAYDSAKGALNTATMWNNSTKTCSNVACHNRQSVNWGDNNGATACISCHTAL